VNFVLSVLNLYLLQVFEKIRDFQKYLGNCRYSPIADIPQLQIFPNCSDNAGNAILKFPLSSIELGMGVKDGTPVRKN